MTTAIRNGQVLDELDRPVPGASIYVYNFDGSSAALTSDGTTPITQPLATDQFGNYTYQALVGYYREDTWYAGKFRFRENNIALGSPGADLALRTDLAAADGSGSALVKTKSAATGAIVRTVQDRLRDSTTVKDFGALEDGATDDAAAVASAAAAGVVIVPPGTLKTNTAPTTFSLASFGASFSGTAALDSPYPTFGTGVFRTIQKGTTNGLIGIVHNNSVANTNALPCAITGYSRIDNGGNAAFGIFGRADLYATTGIATNEVNSFNFGAAPLIANLPPNRAIGTTQSQPIALTVAAGGTFPSSIGVHICREGSAPQSFLTGQYISPDAVTNYGIVVDALSTSTFIPALLKHGVGAIGLQLQGVGTPIAGNGALVYVDGNGVTQWALKQSGAVVGQGMTSASGGIGYSTGAGSTVTQATSKATGVTLNKVCGAITLNAASLAATTIVSFTLTNSVIGADDDVRVWVKSGNASVGSYRVAAEGNGAGSRIIVVENKTAGALAEAIVLGFNVLKAVIA